MKMKIHLRNLGAWMSIILALCAANTVYAAETKGPDSGVSKEMQVARYDERARGVNAPLYSYYAEKIKEKTGITRGVCLDAGSGGGYLGLALAKITDLDFIFLDFSPRALEKAEQHIIEDGLQQRARTLLADVHSIPLADESINLVISRGSIPFWEDPAKALKEIYRVLAPDGKAYVGGGRGTPEIRERIASAMKEMGDAFPENGKKREGSPNRMMQRNYDEIMKRTGIERYQIHKGEDGIWLQIWK